jgi:hypothetical protein
VNSWLCMPYLYSTRILLTVNGEMIEIHEALFSSLQKMDSLPLECLRITGYDGGIL